MQKPRRFHVVVLLALTLTLTLPATSSQATTRPPQSQPIQFTTEYRALDISDAFMQGTGAIVDRLTPLGQEGWEAVSTIGTMVVLRRFIEMEPVVYDYAVVDVAPSLLGGNLDAATVELDRWGEQGFRLATIRSGRGIWQLPTPATPYVNVRRVARLHRC